MPQISIFEKDLTTANVDNLTENIVYVPGYAVIGPVNTPVLCETLEDFQEIFGNLPYKFKTTQNYPSGFEKSEAYTFPDDYEKSYIYAAELLKSGLPVVFERFMDSKYIKSWTAKLDTNYIIGTEKSTDYFNITAKYPGVLGKNISISMLKSVYTNVDGTTSDKFTIEAVIPKDLTKGIYRDLKDSVTFTFNTNRTDYYENVIKNTKYINIYIKGMPDFVTKFFSTTNKITTNLVLTTDAYVKADSNGNITSDEFIIADFYNAMAETSVENEAAMFAKLADKNEYQIKFITSGSYPTFSYNHNKAGNTAYHQIVSNMLTTAALRGDAIALIDHTNDLTKSISDLYTTLNKTDELVGLSSKFVIIGDDATKQEDARKYGAMFTPWATYESKVLSSAVILPASFAYLNSLAVSVQTNANWYAIAGVTRGLVPNLLQLSQNVTGAVANKIQDEIGISINPITNIKPYGYCIWGNRTLNENKGLVASSFLNVRNLASDVKKVVYKAAKKLTFELNTDVLWLNFKAEIEPTLDKMVSGNGLTSYKIMRKASTKRATIEAVIRLNVVEAVENWDITVELSDTTVTVQ